MTNADGAGYYPWEEELRQARARIAELEREVRWGEEALATSVELDAQARARVAELERELKSNKLVTDREMRLRADAEARLSEAEALLREAGRPHLPGDWVARRDAFLEGPK